MERLYCGALRDSANGLCVEVTHIAEKVAPDYSVRNFPSISAKFFALFDQDDDYLVTRMTSLGNHRVRQVY